jgi:hypothetical protein
VPSFKLDTDLPEEVVREALELLDGEWTLKSTEVRVDPRLLELPGSGTQRQGYLLHFLANGPDTREGAKTAMGLDGFSDCHTRVSELITGGWLAETGEEWTTRSGSKAAVVSVTDKARKAINLKPAKWFPGGVRVIEVM